MGIFYSLIKFFISLFFILLGLLSLLIPWSATIRTELVQFILEDYIVIFLFGFAFLIIGVASLISIFFNSRKKYYKIRGGNNNISVDEEVIKQYLSTYWKDLFPQIEVPSHLILKNNKIYIDAELPYFPLTEQKVIVDRIKKDLSDIFSKILGYKNEFLLSLSFQTKKPQ